MLISTSAIVLQTIRYQEKSLIVKCFTETEGTLSFFVKNAFSKNKSQNIAYFQPLSLLNISFIEKKSSNLNYFKSIDLNTPLKSIHTDFNKSCVVLFLAEIFTQTLKKEENESELFNFIKEQILWFDDVDKSPDFHLNILAECTKHLGFYPNTSAFNHLEYFNNKTGVFTTNFTIGECLDIAETLLLKNLLIKKDKLPNEKLNGGERSKSLNVLLKYYATHIPEFRYPKTLEVIKELYE